jgi:lysozyme
MSTNASYDLSVGGVLRQASGSSSNLIAGGDFLVCTGANMGLNAGSAVDVKSGSPMNLQSGAAMSLNGSTVDINNGGSANPSTPQQAGDAPTAKPAEVKPLNDKLNVLATWKDPDTKFQRNSERWSTTISRLPTYEPCPEHDKFVSSSIDRPPVVLTKDDSNYTGSTGSTTTVPVDKTDTNSTNKEVKGDNATDSTTATDVDMDKLRKVIERHEGVKHSIYLDSLGLATGGIGHLLTKSEIPQYPVGSSLSTEQIEKWYQPDIQTAIRIAEKASGSAWGGLSSTRKMVMIDLSYNLGGKIYQFKHFLAKLQSGDYTGASDELKNSVWFNQVGRRGPENCYAMSNDKYTFL